MFSFEDYYNKYHVTINSDIVSKIAIYDSDINEKWQTGYFNSIYDLFNYMWSFPVNKLKNIENRLDESRSSFKYMGESTLDRQTNKYMS